MTEQTLTHEQRIERAYAPWQQGLIYTPLKNQLIAMGDASKGELRKQLEGERLRLFGYRMSRGDLDTNEKDFLTARDWFKKNKGKETGYPPGAAGIFLVHALGMCCGSGGSDLSYPHWINRYPPEAKDYLNKSIELAARLLYRAIGDGKRDRRMDLWKNHKSWIALYGKSLDFTARDIPDRDYLDEEEIHSHVEKRCYWGKFDSYLECEGLEGQFWEWEPEKRIEFSNKWIARFANENPDKMEPVYDSQVKMIEYLGGALINFYEFWRTGVAPGLGIELPKRIID